MSDEKYSFLMDIVHLNNLLKKASKTSDHREQFLFGCIEDIELIFCLTKLTLLKLRSAVAE